MKLTESETKKLDIWISNLETHGYIQKIHTVKSREYINYDQYNLIRNIGPLHPNICNKCGKYISKNMCSKTEASIKEDKIYNKAFGIMNMPADISSYVNIITKFILFYKVREICKMTTFKEIAKHVKCDYHYFKNMCNADINKNDIHINKFYKLLEVFAEDILLWPMNNKEKNDHKKNNKTIPDILLYQVKHYLKKHGDIDIEFFLKNPPGSMKPR
ncbi:MAG TPA: hypothetical protein VMT12_04175 [Syntrophales bacterium]|nr:hypothetical protein [Syntrophales bacterium]